MINFEALFKVSYGLYLVSSGDKTHGNGFISNTVFQVTSEPAKFASCCNKDNYTAQLIEKHGCFAVSVLHQETNPTVFGNFGYKSGKDFNKLEGMNVKYGETGCPVVLDDSVAVLEFKVVDKFDVGTHYMFIGELVSAEILDPDKTPISYDFYRNVKKGMAPKNAPTYIDKSKLEAGGKKKVGDKYQCIICGHIYDEEIEDVKFEDLPDEWKCPICGADKADFELI